MLGNITLTLIVLQKESFKPKNIVLIIAPQSIDKQEFSTGSVDIHLTVVYTLDINSLI